jgi:hypothetical protein
MNKLKVGDKVKVLCSVDDMNNPTILLSKTPVCTVCKVEGDYVYVDETKRFGDIGNVGYHYLNFEVV